MGFVLFIFVYEAVTTFVNCGVMCSYVTYMCFRHINEGPEYQADIPEFCGECHCRFYHIVHICLSMQSVVLI